MKKMHLDAASEAMILKATIGSLKTESVVRAIRSIFPNGKGQVLSKKQDAFEMANQNHGEASGGDTSGNHGVENITEDFDEVLEAVASTVQEESEYDDEDALEFFESYKKYSKESPKKSEPRIQNGQLQQFEKLDRTTIQFAGVHPWQDRPNQGPHTLPLLQEGWTLALSFAVS